MRADGRGIRAARAWPLGMAALSLAAATVTGASAPRVADRIRGQAIAAAHPPLEEPTVLPADRASHMRADDVVLGVVVAGEPRAYPWWVVKNFHVVNDTVNGVPVVVAFCEQCTGAAAFRRTVDGGVASFETAGVYNGTIILRDRATRTLWAPFSGQALEGPLQGRRLERLPLSLVPWSEWRARHPATTVAWGPAVVRDGHGSWYEPGKWGIVGEMGATLTGWDTRLPENTLVYGLDVAGVTRAYPLSGLAAGRVVNDKVGEVPVAIVGRGELEALAFDRRAGGRTLHLEGAPAVGAVMVDRETGSAFSEEGLAVSGPLRGQRLARLDGYVVEWHVWAVYNPATDIAGGPEAPGSPLTPEVPFPRLTLPALDGGAGGEAPLGLEVTLVALWTTWCQPCRAEMPVLEGLWKQHGRAGLSVLGIAVHMPDDEAERALVRDFVSREGITFPNRLVDEAAYETLEALLARAGRPGLVVPTVLVVDKHHHLRAVFRGREIEGLAAALPTWLPGFTR